MPPLARPHALPRRQAHHRLLGALLATSALGPLAPGASQAQTPPWPSRPVRIVVPFAAGGPADALARFIGARMAADLGQAVVIDNKAGAGGTLGAGDVTRSTDGHSLLFASTGAMVIVPAMSPSPGYNPERDLVAVGQAVNTPGVVVVSAKSPFTTLAELLAQARKQPGKLNYASAGSGTSTQLGAELLKREAKVFLTHIPYRGASPALTDLVGGTADLMFADVPAVVSLVQSRQLRALALADTQRSAALPEVPTTAEAGLGKVVGGTWYGLMAPVKTPPEVVAKVNAALNKALQHPETIAFFRAQGVSAAGGTAQDFSRFIRAEAEKWGSLVRSASIKPD